jgi:hypothetical protein
LRFSKVTDNNNKEYDGIVKAKGNVEMWKIRNAAPKPPEGGFAPYGLRVYSK